MIGNPPPPHPNAKTEETESQDAGVKETSLNPSGTIETPLGFTAA